MEFKQIGNGNGKAVAGAADVAGVAADFDGAKRFGKVRVGERYVFFRGLFRAEYGLLSEVAWIYMRQEDSQTSVCCGKATFETYFLIAVFRDGTEKKQQVEKAEEVKAAMEAVRAANPAVDVGFTADLKEKYGKA